MQPLAERLRPRTLDEYIGQKHLVGPGAVLRKMIDAGRISSFILWGPPGVGKTTLAQIIANKLETPFYTLSAVTSGVKDVRDVIERAKSNRFFSQASPILFIDEIHTYFEEPLHQIAENYGITYDEVCLRLKERYDGYRFRQNGTNLYNPFSLLNTFRSLEFGSYWFETGTPTYLVKLLKDNNFCLPDLTSEGVTAETLTDVESFKDNPIAVIYQSGYLTIKEYDEEFNIYRLGFPNKEVAEGFIKYLVPYYMPIKDSESVYFVSNFIADVRKGNPEQFMTRLATMFSDTDYKIVGDAELYFQNAFFIVMRMMGFYTKVERPTSESRMDMVIETKDYVYIVEFKLDGTPEEALQQIEDKGYAKPFAMDHRKLYRIGVNFSLEKRSIDGWKIE